MIVGTVLVATHAASAVYYSQHYASGIIRTQSRPMTLDLTLDQWAQAADGADSTTYLQVARNVAAGKGVTWQIPKSVPPREEPFIYWGPGAPVVLGWWLKLVGGRTMFTFFVFAIVAQLIAGALAVATAALWTRGTFALSLVAFGSGFCPPVQEWLYGIHLTSSEIVALPMLALLFFVLSNAFFAWARCANGNQSGIGNQSESGGIVASAANFRRWLLSIGLNRQAWLWFGLAGALIGCTSLTRDCVRVFAWFIAAFMIAKALAFDRRRLKAAVAVAITLLAGEYAVRYPVQVWNRHRSGRSTICQTSDGCIWRYGLWFKHDGFDWYDSAGIGFGEYLAPDAAARVEAYYKSGKPLADFYSMSELAKAVWQRPIDALAFKTARLPVLWLGTDRWPRVAIRPASIWSAAMYALLAMFIVVQIRRRRAIPEVLYLYLLLVACASPVMHFEFRYTFPIWNTLVLVPGLFAATLSRDGWQSQRRDRGSGESACLKAIAVCSEPTSRRSSLGFPRSSLGREPVAASTGFAPID